MAKARIALLVTLIICALLTNGSSSAQATAAAGGRPLPGESRQGKGFRSSPVMFVENAGQFDEGARYQVRGAWGGSLWLAEDALWLTFVEPGPPPEEPWERLGQQAVKAEAELRQGVNLRLTFAGANPLPEIVPLDRLDTSVNYFLGNDPASWRSKVPVWGGVRYVDLYPGIDLEMGSEEGHFAWQLAVREPGFPLSQVRLRVEGAEAGGVQGGDLWLDTAVGQYTLRLLTLEGAPLGGYTTVSRGTGGAFEVSEPFSRTRSIRSSVAVASGPSGLGYGTFLGGSHALVDNGDWGADLALDRAGNAILTGWTESSDFPTTTGAFDPGHNGSFADVFVSKLSADGRSLLYSTFVGGASYDLGEAMVVDGLGQAVVAGTSRSADFPTTDGAYDTTGNGEIDVFVLKLSSDGRTLLYSSLIGGSGPDWGHGLAMDSEGNVVVVGETESSDFPTTVAAYDTTYSEGGDYEGDAFVFKLSADGRSLLFSTFIGGSSDDGAWELALDSADNVVVTGWSMSVEFPTTAGAYDTSHNGDLDVFLLKLSADGRLLLYSTFLGGSGGDTSRRLVLDRPGNAIVTGSTASADFPATAGAYDTSHNGDEDVFLTKLSADGRSLVYSTFVGGSGDDHGRAVALDGARNTILTGHTRSYGFPTTVQAYDRSHNGDGDSFVLRLSPDARLLLHSTFVGGAAYDWAVALALDGSGQAVVAGSSLSADFPTTVGAFDRTHNGGYCDVIIFKLRFPPVVYLPLVGRIFTYYFEGPWEREPNNSADQANGPLRSGRPYQGYPNDQRDYFSIRTRTTGEIAVDLTDHTGQGVQLQLFYQTPGNVVKDRREPPYSLSYTGPAGIYYIYIYAESGHHSTNPYTLQVRYP